MEMVAHRYKKGKTRKISVIIQEVFLTISFCGLPRTFTQILAIKMAICASIAFEVLFDLGIKLIKKYQS